MDELDQPCQVKHGEGWRPGRGRYREEGPMQINPQSQKKAHTDTKSSVLENLKVAHFVSIMISQYVGAGHRPFRCTSNNSHVWSCPTSQVLAWNCRTQLFIVFKLSGFSHTQWMKSCTVPRTDSVLLWNDFHELHPTQTAIRLAPGPECEAVIQRFSLVRA